MDREYLKQQRDNGLTIREIAEIAGIKRGSVEYYIDKYDLRTKIKNTPHLCKCGEIDPSKFKPRDRSMCKRCADKLKSQRRVDKKLKAIEYKGGMCLHCDYDTFYGALEFHHVDPSEKDYEWKELAKQPWEEIVKELDKCILLCSNCHREEHNKIHLAKYEPLAQ